MANCLHAVRGDDRVKDNEDYTEGQNNLKVILKKDSLFYTDYNHIWRIKDRTRNTYF